MGPWHAATWIFLATGSCAQENPARAINPRSFQELERTTVPAAGGVVVGVTSNGVGQFNGELRVRVPSARDPRATRVCVELNSIDGRHWAKAEFDVSAGPGVKRLVIPSAAQSRVSKSLPDELAVSAALASRCDVASNFYLEASFDAAQGDRAGGFARIMVIAQPGTSVALLDQATNTTTACERLNASANVTFSMICQLRTPSATTADLLLIRRHFESRLPDSPLKVARQ